MLIVVCGLSKCGKTSLLVAAAEQGLEVPSVKASHLLRSYNRPTLTLTASEAVSNQAELMQLLAGYAREDLSIILDGHLYQRFCWLTHGGFPNRGEADSRRHGGFAPCQQR